MIVLHWEFVTCEYLQGLYCLLPFVRLFGDDDHDDVEATFGSLTKKKEKEEHLVSHLLVLSTIKPQIMLLYCRPVGSVESVLVGVHSIEPIPNKNTWNDDLKRYVSCAEATTMTKIRVK